MIPVVALVGRPNVGKSTLFNRLTRSREALVDDQPGVTRDRLYGEVAHQDQRFLLIDTGGLSDDGDVLSAAVREQVFQALSEADAVVFLLDAREGLSGADRDIAEDLRRDETPVLVAVNKAEGLDRDITASEFFELSMGAPQVVSAKTGQGVSHLLDAIFNIVPDTESGEVTSNANRIAIVGRPNVGKSTLVNCLAGEPRMIVADLPGTTRDSVAVPVERDGETLLLLDTAGVRRKSRVRETLEKFSVVKTLQALASAEAAVLVLDAREGVSDQDATIAGLIIETGRSIVIAINKWDGLERRDRNAVRRELSRKLDFLPEPESIFISAKHGSGIAELTKAIRGVRASAMAEMGTSILNRALAQAVEHHKPPMVNNRTIKPKYAHQGGRNPPTVVLHGNTLHKLPPSYLRYLGKSLARTFKLKGTRIRFELRNAENPYDKRKAPRRGRR